MDRYKKKWVKGWDTSLIIGSAVSLGMQFMADKISTEDLHYNKKLLIEELNKRIKSLQLLNNKDV